jgi:hypothetical protein
MTWEWDAMPSGITLGLCAQGDMERRAYGIGLDGLLRCGQ